jgi:pilus assembly protein CpaE
LSFAESAQGLREALRDEAPGSVGVIVGLSDAGVSDLNLAAAVVHDGMAARVVLVARDASGSLRSRAARAGVSEVIDLAAPGEVPSERRGRESLPHPTGASARSERIDEVEARDPQVEGPSRAEAEEVETRPFTRRPRVEEGKGPILTFASARGGVGKTTLVSAAAAIAGGWGMRVAMVDLDLSCGNLYSCFGVRPVDLARLASKGALPNETMGRSCARCRDDVYLWGPCERPEMAETVMPHVGELLAFLSERFDVVLVDTSTTFTDAVAEAAQRCDRLLLVHDDESASLGSLARASSLAVRLGVARTRIMRVQNFMDSRQKLDLSLGRAEVGLEGARAFSVLDGGVEVAELLSGGHAGELAGGDTPFAASVASMLAQVLSEVGCLPDTEEARTALEGRGRKSRFSFFKKKEAV